MGDGAERGGMDQREGEGGDEMEVEIVRVRYGRDVIRGVQVGQVLPVRKVMEERLRGLRFVTYVVETQSGLVNVPQNYVRVREEVK